MKRMMQATAALVLSFTVSACSGDRSPGADDNRVPGTVGTSGTVNADRDFVHDQLAMGTADVELGRLAQQRATHADVKEFAAMMVRDHQMAADELRPIAKRVNTDRDTKYDADDHKEHRDLMEDLSKLSGRDFDRKYIDEMIDDHEKGIRELEGRAENAADADVKQWASKTLPTMREHLERAKAIKETLDRAGDY
jgi:putative membrane protein